MSPASAARGLAASLVLFGALSARADDSAPASAVTAAPTSAAPLATSFAPPFEVSPGDLSLVADGPDPLARLSAGGAGRGAEPAGERPGGARWTAAASALPTAAASRPGPVLRDETRILVPLGRRIALETTLVDHHDASRAAEAESRKLETLVGVAVRF